MTRRFVGKFMLGGGIGVLAMLQLAGAGAEETVRLPDLVVTAMRSPVAAEQLPLSVDRYDTAAMATPTALTLDDALRDSPAFNLFRRTSSLTANPASQGVSLRGIGPSGASRSLILLDGFPLNDPFGGWVAWSKIPRLTVGSAEIVRGGGSGVWGSAAIGGVVQMISTPPVPGGGAALVELGDKQTLRAEAVSAFGTEDDVFRVGARWFRTDGWHGIRADQRGEIDRPLDSRHWVAHGDWTHTLRDDVRLSAGFRVFDDKRGNGTPYTGNTSSETAARLAFEGSVAPGVQLHALGYVQTQTFTSQFSSVAADRNSERPALDQYEVPSTAWGTSVVTTWAHDAETATTLGGDLRFVSGETREDYFYSDGQFLRRRHAGGEQWTAGLFASHHRKLAEGLTGHISGRLDGWWLGDGHRRDWNKVTGEQTRDDRYADRNGAEFSPGAGLVWRVSENWRLRGSIYRAFRLPTLNEFYRPFRVGSVATDANPNLSNESLTGLDLGAEFTQGSWRFSVGGFVTELDDAVANVTLSTTPTFTQRQRQNLEKVRVRGLEAGVEFRPGAGVVVTANYLLSDATVYTGHAAPNLEGKRLPQVPLHTGTVRVAWHPSERWRIDVSGRAFSKQYEDDLNTLPLAAGATLDFGVSWFFMPGWEAGLAVDNLFDAEVETRRTASGLVSVAPGRFARLSVRTTW